jgi:hypothetical protein
MAVDLNNRDSLFLTSQYNHAEENTILAVDNKPTNQNGSTSLASSDFGSALSSPTESELGSTESESDQDDDYIAELSRQMAHHMLQDDDHERHEKVCVLCVQYSFIMACIYIYIYACTCHTLLNQSLIGVYRLWF